MLIDMALRALQSSYIEKLRMIRSLTNISNVIAKKYQVKKDGVLRIVHCP